MPAQAETADCRLQIMVPGRDSDVVGSSAESCLKLTPHHGLHGAGETGNLTLRPFLSQKQRL